MAETELEAALQQEPADSLAIVAAGEAREPSEEPSESEEEEDDVDLPPGPLDPEQVTLGGPGARGGAAQSTVSLFVTAKDERGTRIREGGAYVVATIQPGNAARAAGADTVHAEVKDSGDGTYVVTYSVAARGDYEVRRTANLLCVHLNCMHAQAAAIPKFAFFISLLAGMHACPAHAQEE